MAFFFAILRAQPISRQNPHSISRELSNYYIWMHSYRSIPCYSYSLLLLTKALLPSSSSYLNFCPLLLVTTLPLSWLSQLLLDSEPWFISAASLKPFPTSSSMNKGKSHNNYAVELATSNNFTDNPTGLFFVNTKGGTKGDYFLVAIGIAEKR